MTLGCLTYLTEGCCCDKITNLCSLEWLLLLGGGMLQGTDYQKHLITSRKAGICVSCPAGTSQALLCISEEKLTFLIAT